MTNITSFKKILSPANQKIFKMTDNPVWRFRGEIWDTIDRESAIFGDFPSEDIDTFIKCSQYIQYEGLRYALMANRRRSFRNCGSIIWQFNEPMPNISCTNLVDFYCEPKLAYFALKNSYRTVAIGLKYNKLVWKHGESIQAELYLVNDLDKYIGELIYTVCDVDGNILQKHTHSVFVAENGTVEVCKISIPAPESPAVYISVQFTYNQIVTDDTYLLFIQDEKGLFNGQLAVKQYDEIRKAY